LPFQATFTLNPRVCLESYSSTLKLICLLNSSPALCFHSTHFKSNFKLCFSTQWLIYLLKPSPKPGFHFIHSMHLIITFKAMPPSMRILLTSSITPSLIFTLDPLNLSAAFVVAVIWCRQIYSHPVLTSSPRTHAPTIPPLSSFLFSMPQTLSFFFITTAKTPSLKL
jgi:hypothetical protein